MKCDVCHNERNDLVHIDKDGTCAMICPECMAHQGETDACRCKETVGKTPSEVLKMVVKDMFGRKK